MRIELVDHVSDGAWTAFLAGCPGATFFHTPEWYQAHAQALDYAPRPYMLRTPDGREALLPMATRAALRGLTRRAHAGVENGYGGLLTREPWTAEEEAAAYAAVRRRHPDLVVTGNPFAAHQPGTGAVEATDTQVLPVLAPAEQLKAMDESRAKKAKKGAKAGFTLEVIHPLTEEDVMRFFPLYAERAAGWEYKRWVRDESYFRALARHAGSRLALFLAYQGHELAGFQLLGLAWPHVTALYLATAKAHEPQQVGPFLAVAPLAWCHERGFTTYDLLASGQLASVKVYKASLGAETRPYAIARHEGALMQAAGAIARFKANLAWPGAASPAPQG